MNGPITDYLPHAGRMILIDELIEPATGFSDAAVAQLNRYASGGFDKLVETLPDRPRTSPEFFRVYLELLDEAP